MQRRNKKKTPLIWLIGLSASGKTTIGQQLFETLKPTHPGLVFLDGDMIRSVLGGDVGHTLDDRRRNAERICRLGKLLSDQGLPVIVAILSIFPESRKWNRENVDGYYEVWVKASIDACRKREFKGIYSRYDEGLVDNVAGLDLTFPEPASADLILDNEQSRSSMTPFIWEIARGLDKAEMLDVPLEEIFQGLKP